jgi:2-oxoisovalerate ferredoxin oxidoreductase beta subunit
VGNVQAAHGRASAVASAVKRSRPGAIVIGYQGDGDLAAIGTAEIIHAANRGEGITIIFVNNGIYGMTGGQMAPTTMVGRKSTTSPLGRNPDNEGYPIHVCELLSALQAPVFIERVSLGGNKAIMQAAKVIRKALEVQVKGLGFSLVEVLSPCPTIWKMQPVEAMSFVRDEMAPVFGVANYRDRTKEAQPHPAAPPPPPLEDLPKLLDVAGDADFVPVEATRELDMRIRVAGFGGQGVLMLGEVLAEAGLQSGYEVSWLPSYGPEMRSGTSNCHVRLSKSPIDSPLVSRPNVLLALNEPSLRKFLASVEPGGLVLYNAATIPEDCVRPDLRTVTRPFTELADQMGSAKVGNILMVGALLEATGLLEQERVVGALKTLIRNPKLLELDVKALDHGRRTIAADCC